jgi:hypothetical protein
VARPCQEHGECSERQCGECFHVGSLDRAGQGVKVAIGSYWRCDS